MKQQILKEVFDALEKLRVAIPDDLKQKITVTNPDPKLGDFATNVALILAKISHKKPRDLAQEIIAQLDKDKFKSIEVAGAGFINFKLSNKSLLEALGNSLPSSSRQHLMKRVNQKTLLEYFQPNIAKPLHIGHLRTAIIGDALKRMMIYLGDPVESDTHMGDWGTQFGFLILGCKQLKNFKPTDEELNKIYVELNARADKDPQIHEQAKQEFVKLEQGDKENREIWQQLVELSVQKFLNMAQNFDLLPFDHHWPESYYEDKMPTVLDELRSKKLLVESQGAQIVNLEDQKLGIAVIVKSDGGTTYLLRDLATFMFVKKHGFNRHLYVVDNRQSHHYHQLFAILRLMGNMTDDEGEHIDYGFISFKGEALSTRRGNMVLAEDVMAEARKRVTKIIKEKNPDLRDKEKAIHAISVGALKYYDLSHNRHSDYEFDWDEALDFEGNSGPYLQYANARLSSILGKVSLQGSYDISDVQISETERELILKSLALPEMVAESLKDYLPNLLANYLFDLAGIINKFYHESPVMNENDEKLKFFRLSLIRAVKETLSQGLNLLGIEALDEM